MLQKEYNFGIICCQVTAFLNPTFLKNKKTLNNTVCSMVADRNLGKIVVSNGDVHISHYCQESS